METQSYVSAAKVVDKKGKGVFSLGACGLRFSDHFKSRHHGKVTSQDQQDPKATGPLGGQTDFKDLVNGSASNLQESQIYSCRGIGYSEASVDAGSSIVLTKLLECITIQSSKVNHVEATAYETVISACLNQAGLGTVPQTLCEEPAELRGSTLKQPLVKIKLTENTTILHVPYAYAYTIPEELPKEISEIFQLRYGDGIQVVYLLEQMFCVTVITTEKEINSMGNELPGEVIWGLQPQLKLTEFLGGYFKFKFKDLANGSDKGHASSSSHEGDKHLPQGGDELREHGGASASSSGRDKKFIRGEKPLKPGVQKQAVAKKIKY